MPFLKGVLLILLAGKKLYMYFLKGLLLRKAFALLLKGVLLILLAGNKLLYDFP